MTPDNITLAGLVASLDDDVALVAVTALEASWRDRHSCRDAACWGMAPYPVDLFTRILTAAITATGKPDPVFCDAGAGIGGKVLLARRAGCQAWGVEHNPHYVTEAVKLGANVVRGDVREVDYSTAADIVWVNDPFRDPEREAVFEARVAARIRPGGVLAIGNRGGPAPVGWAQLTSVVGRDGAWQKPGG